MSRTVLICDDALFMRKLIHRVMTSGGFEVVGEAENGSEAVDKYQTLQPDLVTMDLIMPKMNGIDAVREIMKRDSTACIIMCSSVGQEAFVTEAMKEGARGYLVKPFQPPQLLAAAERALKPD